MVLFMIIYVFFNCLLFEGPYKRTKQVTTLLRVVGGFWPTLLRPFAWTFKAHANGRNKSQHCCAKQCWELLALVTWCM